MLVQIVQIASLYKWKWLPVTDGGLCPRNARGSRSNHDRNSFLHHAPLPHTRGQTNRKARSYHLFKCYLIISPNQTAIFLLGKNANQHLPPITPVSLKRPPRSDWSEDRLLLQVTIQRRRLLALLPLWLDLSLYYALPPFTSLSSYQTVK